MASKKFGKGSDEWMMFMDFWTLCQKHWIYEDNDEYFDAVIRESNEFFEKYKKIPLARKMSIAFVETVIGKDRT